MVEHLNIFKYPRGFTDSNLITHSWYFLYTENIGKIVVNWRYCKIYFIPVNFLSILISGIGLWWTVDLQDSQDTIWQCPRPSRGSTEAHRQIWFRTFFTVIIKLLLMIYDFHLNPWLHQSFSRISFAFDTDLNNTNYINNYAAANLFW